MNTKRRWKIPMTPRSIALRNRRGVDRQTYVRLDAYVEPDDLEVIRRAANVLGFTQSDIVRAILREAVESGRITAATGHVDLESLLSRDPLPDELSPQSAA